LQPFLNGISAEFVAFSRDEKSVAYVTYPEGILWRANADGSEKIQVTDPPMYPHNPRWSPDGSRIVFEDIVKGKSMAYIVPASGGKPQRLQLQPDVPMSDPNWSPDGSKILFETCDCAEPIAEDAPFLEILDLKTHQVTRLPGGQGLYSARWSPDGKFIVALPRNGRPPKIYSFDSRSWSEIPFEGQPGWPCWSHDGRFIYFMKTAAPEVLRFSLAGGKTERVADLAGMWTIGWYGSWMGLDTGDAPLVLRNESAEDIYALTLERK
jgi:dipeptidyl aminopeptidase/acylaminoacyl peptidase